jgi:hypothetical protein
MKQEDRKYKKQKLFNDGKNNHDMDNNQESLKKSTESNLMLIVEST